MTLTVLPNGDGTTNIEESDWEKYFDFVQNSVVSGFVITSVSGTQINVGVGEAWIHGHRVSNVAEAITPANTNRFLHVKLDRTTLRVVTGVSFDFRTSRNTIDDDFLFIGEVVRNAGGTAYVIDQSDILRGYEFGEMIDGRREFGTGADGDVVISANTTISRDMNYRNLTVNDGATLTVTNDSKIRVLDTFDLQGSMLSVGGAGQVYRHQFDPDNSGTGAEQVGGIGSGNGGDQLFSGETIDGITHPRHSSHLLNASVENADLIVISVRGGGSGSGAEQAGNGGAAGGFIAIFANNVRVNGNIVAAGGDGQAGPRTIPDFGSASGGGGGGGVGGFIGLFYRNALLPIVADRFDVSQGLGGEPYNQLSADAYGKGGDGEVGVLWIVKL